jgi:phosphatidylserine decarboxylase
MAKPLAEWLDTDVQDAKDRPLSWLSEQFFFRDPARPAFSSTRWFFSPADGVILYQEVVDPGDPILDIKGRPYSLRDALRDPDFTSRSLVIGIFMTFFDVHVNRVPYPGRLSYRPLDPIDTLNHPMLEVEQSILEGLRLSIDDQAQYLHRNQRMVNRIDSPHLPEPYYILQVADYDVDSILPFELKQNRFAHQGQRFSQIRYGSQVDLIIPVSDRYELAPVHEPGTHVEGGTDALVEIIHTQHGREPAS